MKKLLLMGAALLSFGRIQAAVFGANIHSQPTLQSGTTAYPQFLYVGSSATIPSLSLTTLTSSTGTINNLTASTGTLSNLTVNGPATFTGSFSAPTGSTFSVTTSSLTLGVAQSTMSMRSVMDATGNKILNVSSGTTASDATRYSQTKLLGIQQFTTTTSTQTTSTSFVISNLTLTTPTPQSAASRFLLSMSGTMTNSAAGTNTCLYAFGRNGSNINGAQGIGNFDTGVATSADLPISMTYIDAPASAVALTYTVMFRSGGGGITCSLNVGGQTGVFIVEEINGL